MAGSFAMVERGFWSDETVGGLSTDARLLFLWSWTNPRATIAGLYPVGQGPMRAALDRPDEARGARVRDALAELDAAGLVRYDDENEVLWVVNRARYANRSPATVKGMEREWRECPPSPLRDAFKRKYGRVLELGRKRGAA